MTYKVYRKKNLFEDDNKTAYVTQTGAGSSSSNLSKDIQNSAMQNPTTKNFVVNGNNYDNDSTDNNLTLDVTAKNSTDAANKIQALNKTPQVKRMGGDAMFNVRLEQVERKISECVEFTKKELNELLKR